jgi:hypothetical protein
MTPKQFPNLFFTLNSCMIGIMIYSVELKILILRICVNGVLEGTVTGVEVAGWHGPDCTHMHWNATPILHNAPL